MDLYFCYRYLYLPLVDAERCWSYAMQLKAEANTEPRKRFHMQSRLKKAVVHAENLAALCENEKCDARTKLEAQVRHSMNKRLKELPMLFATLSSQITFEVKNIKGVTNLQQIYHSLFRHMLLG